MCVKSLVDRGSEVAGRFGFCGQPTLMERCEPILKFCGRRHHQFSSGFPRSPNFSLESRALQSSIRRIILNNETHDLAPFITGNNSEIVSALHCRQPFREPTFGMSHVWDERTAHVEKFFGCLSSATNYEQD